MDETIREALRLIKEHHLHFPYDFHQYILDNQHIYLAFAEQTVREHKRHEKFGIDVVAGYLRWQTAMRERAGEFKISNNATAYIARVLFFQFPKHRIYRMKRTRVEVRNNIMPPDHEGV